ncbi:MAG TPA: phenylalanine--tRNA ligase subunit alpha [Candidatus Kapabacteria bacterium]|nr:phenylalanine--tRNA ligase subunit alpha [Candidatus Kapabacteria bacterium]
MTVSELQAKTSELLGELNRASSTNELDAFKLAHLVRKGSIAGLFENLKNVPKDIKPEVGKALNELRQSVENAFKEKESSLGGVQKSSAETIDLTMPARPLSVSEPGHEHPLTLTLERMVGIFTSMGFDIADGPEIEDDEHNFGKLNFAPDHPARDMQDTFFVKPSANWDPKSGEKPVLLRTHTSPVQVRVMESWALPIRAIMPGRVYRNEEITARSAACFFQLEGLVIGKGVSMADLKAVLLEFARQFFGADSRIRLRPSYFPFTEPSVEVDVSCYICGGKGCRVCKHSGWLEILGAGMVHPNVLRNCGIDPETYTGYAFGMGIDRTAMMRYGVNDLRMFTENDYRFLRQF